MIGDGITDIEAGCAAGAKTIFVGQSKPYIFEAFERHCIKPDFMAPSLAEAVTIIKNNWQLRKARNLQRMRNYACACGNSGKGGSYTGSRP